MGIFTKIKNKEELVLVFDIRSSSVGGALFWTQKSGVPKIIFSVRESIALEDNVRTNRLLSLTLKSLEIVANRIHTAGMGVPKKIFCILASPWHFSQTRVIRLEKNAPFVFTSKLADDLIQKEITLFEQEHLAKYLDIKNKLRLIEFKNIKTMLNDYETSKPLNQKAKELEMTIFISMSGELILQKIEETIRKYFNFDKIKFSSSLLVSFAVVRDMYVYNDNFLLVEIGGEVTDISMVKKNILRESISFPLGLNFIIRGVSSVSKSSLSEAKSLVSLLKDGHATESVENNLGLVVDKLKKEWLSRFQESLSNLSNDISVPSTIYMVVDKEMAEFFLETIKIEQFNQYTLTESKFVIFFLGIEALHGMAVFKEDIIRDSDLVIDSIYINRFLINSVKTG